MELLADLHIHTTASGHAYSSVEEVCKTAFAKGLRMVAITDHGPAMPGGPHAYYFGNLRVLSPFIKGVRVLSGIEANIINFEGEIDLGPGYLEKLDLVWAGMHSPCIRAGNRRQNTDAYINALANPYVNGIVHPGNPEFEIDAEKVVLKVKEEQKIIEINSSSLFVRPGSKKFCLEIAGLAKESGCTVAVNSDAHFSEDVGNLDAALELVKKAGIPQEQVINADPSRVIHYIERRRNYKN